MSNPAVLFDKETDGYDLAIVHQCEEVVYVLGYGNDIAWLKFNVKVPNFREGYLTQGVTSKS